MAGEKIVIELDIETGKAVTNLDKIDESIDNIGESSQKAQKSSKSFGKTLGNLGKAAGIIGLLSAAFEVLQEALGNNQKVIDSVSTATTALGIAFNDLFGFISDNVGTVVEFFKEAFENPSKLLSDFADAIKNNIEVRIKALIKTFGLLGDTVSKIFEGDFSGALDSASEAAETYVDVLTGVEGTVDKVVEGVSDLVDATTDYVTTTYQAADAITAQRKEANLLELQQQRIIEQYDLAAEGQRALRDDTQNSIDDRIKANEKLGQILTDQANIEKKILQGRIDNLQNEQEELGFTQERYEEIFKLQTEQEEVDARIAGFRAEQLTNTNALLSEQTQILNELNLIGASESEAAVIRAEQEYEKRLEIINREITDEEEKNRLLELAAQDFLSTITSIEDKARTDKEAKDDKALKKQLDNEKVLRDAKIDAASNVISVVSSLAEEGSNIAKAAAVAQATIDTYKGATAAYASLAGIPVAGPALGIAAAAAAVAAGIANVRKILQTNTSTKSVSTPNISAPTQTSTAATAPPPEFAAQQDTGQNQLGDDIANALSQRPIKTYVLSQDVTNEQEFNRNTLDNATL